MHHYFIVLVFLMMDSVCNIFCSRTSWLRSRSSSLMSLSLCYGSFRDGLPSSMSLAFRNDCSYWLYVCERRLSLSPAYTVHLLYCIFPPPIAGFFLILLSFHFPGLQNLSRQWHCRYCQLPTFQYQLSHILLLASQRSNKNLPIFANVPIANPPSPVLHCSPLRFRIAFHWLKTALCKLICRFWDINSVQSSFIYYENAFFERCSNIFYNFFKDVYTGSSRNLYV